MKSPSYGSRFIRRLAGLTAGLLVGAAGCATEEPPAVLLSCEGSGAGATPASALDPSPPSAAEAVRRPPGAPFAVQGGPSAVLASTDGGLDVYRVTPRGDLLRSRVGAAGTDDQWRLPLGEPFRPDAAWVTVTAPRGADAPLVVASHRQVGERQSRWTLVSPTGERLLSCVWRPYDRLEHVEFAHGGDAVVATRTTRRPRLNGSSDVADRFVEIHSTRTGTLLGRFRSTDFAQDGALVYGRSGTTVLAHAVSDGRRVWRTDTEEELGDPRRKGADPVHLAGERVLVQARDARTTIALDSRSGRQVWRAVLPGRMEAVHPLGGERVLVQYRGGFAFAGPEGIEHTVAVPPPGNSGRQRLEHLAVIDGSATAAVVDGHDVSAPVLTVFSDRGESARRPLRIPLPTAHVQAVLTRSTVYVLPWVPDGRQATLRAYDLAGGLPLWSADVPDRLTITDSAGPAPSLHAFRGGLYGVDYASGWILPSS